MRTRTLSAVALLALPLAIGSYGRYNTAQAQPAFGTPAALHDDDDRKRDNSRDAREMGRRDGMQAANDDMRDRRRANATARQEYRHPPVDKHARNDYRAGFRDGYDDAARSFQSQGNRDYNNRRDDRDYNNNRQPYSEHAPDGDRR
jgi:hypothetical protein